MEFALPLFFGLGLFICFVAVSRMMRARSKLETRLEAHISPSRSLEDFELSQPFETRIIRPILRGLARALTRLTPSRNYEAARHKLELAGNPNSWTVVDFLGLRAVSAILAGIVFYIVFAVLNYEQAYRLLFVGIGAILGFYVPLFWLNMKIRSRQEDMRLALPDALDLLTTSVEAGLGLDAAIAQVANKWDNDLSRAFAQTLGEIRLGKARRDALRAMSNRAEVPDLTNFIAAVIQAEQLGVGISKILRIQSEQMRIKRRQRAEELANQAGVKMVIPLVFFFFPSMFVVILGPAVIRFITKGFGP